MNGHSAVFGQVVQQLGYCWIYKIDFSGTRVKIIFISRHCRERERWGGGVCRSSPQGPNSQILLTGGWVRERFIFYTQRITTSEFVYPKKSLLFIAYPKKSLIPFFATPQNPSVFLRDPKKSRRLSWTQKNHF